MTTTSPFVTNNMEACGRAINNALDVLPRALDLKVDELKCLARKDDRVAQTLFDTELTLIEALLPAVRNFVEAGSIELAEGDDYLLVSANLARSLMQRWLVVDLRKGSD